MEKSSSGFNDRLEEHHQSDRVAEDQSQGEVVEEEVDLEQPADRQTGQLDKAELGGGTSQMEE